MLFIKALNCVAGDEKLIYLSGPITTGIRFVNGDSTPLTANVDDMRAAASALRKARPEEIVLEPSSLFVPEWDEDNYMELWREVIATRVKEVAFMPNWQYSAGAAQEFLKAVECGIPTTTVNGLRITPKDGHLELFAAYNGVCQTIVGGDGREGLFALSHKLHGVLKQLWPRAK